MVIMPPDENIDLVMVMSLQKYAAENRSFLTFWNLEIKQKM
jgi:hypothetical protein